MKAKKILRKIKKYQKKGMLIDLETLPLSYYCKVTDNRLPFNTYKVTEYRKNIKAAFIAAFKLADKMIKELD